MNLTITYENEERTFHSENFDELIMTLNFNSDWLKETVLNGAIITIKEAE